MYYIEFKHEQSDFITGITFENISQNDRVLTFEIITNNNFKYSGWYFYYLYENNILIENGKLYINEEQVVKEYNRSIKEKKIYKR